MARTRHFCCCIPVRIAVFFFSLLSFLVAGAVAGLAWYATYRILENKDDPSTPKDAKIYTIVVGSLSTIVTLISLFGFIGSITRNLGFVRTYAWLTWVQLTAAVVNVGLVLYIVFSGKPLFNTCYDDNGNTLPASSCEVHFDTVAKAVTAVVAAIILAVILYIVIVIGRYVEQLEDDKDLWRGDYSLTTTDVNKGLLNQTGSYPYTDAPNAYSNTTYDRA